LRGVIHPRTRHVLIYEVPYQGDCAKKMKIIRGVIQELRIDS